MFEKIQYAKRREFNAPRTCGMDMDEMTLSEMRNLVSELTDEEKKSPFAKWYYDPMQEKTDEQKAAYETPLREEQMFMPEAAGRIILEHDERYPDNGYGIMDNGVGYAAIRIDQTGITDEMIREYRENFANEPDLPDLYYKIWFPGRHIRHFNDGVIEDFGYGAMVLKMDLDRYGLKHLGLTREYIEENTPDVLSMMMLGGSEYMLWAPERTQQSVMMKCIRETADGRVIYVRFWNGLVPNEDGTCTAVPSGTRAEVETKMRCQFNHCLSEYYHELKHVKDFWNLNHPDRKV